MSERPRDILLEARMAVSTLRNLGNEARYLKQVGVLAELLTLLERAGKTRTAGGILCDSCQSVVFLPEDELPSLLELLHRLQAHTCATKEREPVSEVAKAWAAMQHAKDDLETEGADPTFVQNLVSATLTLVHEVVKRERDRIAGTYTNSGAERTDDLDALDVVVALTEPEAVLNGE